MNQNSQNLDYSDLKIQKKAGLKKVRKALQVMAFRVLGSLIGLLSVRNIQKLGFCLGSLAHKVCKRERNISLRQLRFCFPDLPEEKIEEISINCFRQFGASLTEFIALDKIRGEFDRWVNVKNLDIVKKHLNDKRGCIVIFAHFGNWELFSPLYQRQKIQVLGTMRDYHIESINEAIIKRRESEYVKMVGRNSPRLPTELIRFLKQKKVLMTAMDVDSDVKNHFVPFFGKRAMTSGLVAKLSLKYNLPVAFAYGVRGDDGVHEITFEHAFDPLECEEPKPDDESLTALFNLKLENAVRKHPESWVWFHRRWRHTPESRAASAAEGDLAEKETKSTDGNATAKDSPPC